MAKRSLILTSTSAKGNTLSKSITDINPKTEDVVLRTFAQKLNNMTTNTYVRTDCVDKFNVDTEGDLRVRQIPTVSFADGNWLKVPKDPNDSIATKLTTDSDGEISVEVHGWHGCNISYFVKNGENILTASRANSSFTFTPGKVTLRIAGTETFKPFEATYDFVEAD